MTKKLFSVLLSLLLVISFAENTFAKELSAASYTVNQFINSYTDAGMKEWGGFHALEEDPLYDSSLDLVGYDVRIFNGNTYGYAFVLIDSDGYYVAEASIETESPFRLNQAEVRIYAGPSNYYSLEERNNRAISLISGEEVFLSSVRPLSMNLIAENKKTYNVKASNTGTLSMSNFETQLQSSGYKCIPTSFAMAMKYLHNTGQSTINSAYTDTAVLRDTLFSYMNGTTSGCFTPHIDNGLNSFTSSYCNHTLRCYNGVWGSSISYSTITGEIDGNYPAVIIFPPGTFSFNSSSNHACTATGYYYTGVGDYVIVRDPWDGASKTMSWSTVTGYFVIYVF